MPDIDLRPDGFGGFRGTISDGDSLADAGAGCLFGPIVVVAIILTPFFCGGILATTIGGLFIQAANGGFGEGREPSDITDLIGYGWPFAVGMAVIALVSGIAFFMIAAGVARFQGALRVAGAILVVVGVVGIPYSIHAAGEALRVARVEAAPTPLITGNGSPEIESFELAAGRYRVELSASTDSTEEACTAGGQVVSGESPGPPTTFERGRAVEFDTSAGPYTASVLAAPDCYWELSLRPVRVDVEVDD